MRKLQIVLTSAVLLTATSMASAQGSAESNTVVLDPSGRTLSAATSWAEDQPITIRFRGEVSTVCENLRVSYAWHDDVMEPEPLFADAKAVYGTIETKSLASCKTNSPSLEIPRVSGKRMLTYTVWKLGTPTESDGTAKAAVENELMRLRPLFDPNNTISIKSLTREAFADLRDLLETTAVGLDEAVTRRADTVTLDARNLKGLEEDAKLFAGTSDATGIQTLRGILADLRTARDALRASQDAQAGDQRSSKALRSVRDRMLEAVFFPVKACASATVLKIGGLLPARTSKSVYYNFTQSPAPPGVSLVLMGGYPRVNQDDRLFAIVANRALTAHRYPFTLSATRVVSAPPILAPVRPTFDVAKAIAPGDSAVHLLSNTEKSKTDATVMIQCDAVVDASSVNTAFRDSVLPFQERFVGNEVLTVSISTYISHLATDKSTTTVEGTDSKVTKQTIVEAKVVDLVDSVKYPQVRALYRFNFATGAVVSSLRDPSFVRVKTAANDPDTTTVDEARYQLETSEGSGRVFPAFLLSTYLKRVDIQEPVWRRCGTARCPGWRMLPAPSVGFSIANPADNVFIGVTSELLENVHLFVGRHNGKVNELVTPRDGSGTDVDIVRADRDSADPKLRTRRTWDWAWGVTFNINALSSFIK